jgi:hypothetical protein
MGSHDPFGYLKHKLWPKERLKVNVATQVGVSKSPKLGLPRLWGAITLRSDLWLRWGLKQSCSVRQELSNSMSHAICTHRNRVDSRLLVVGSQIANLTPNPSFGHNLCFRCPNRRCEPILDIYVPRSFHWYKELNSLSFDPYNRPLNIQESTGTPTPNLGVMGQNDIWALAPWPGIENTIRRKVVPSPSPGRGTFVHQKCSNTLTNLFINLCKFV